MYSLSKEKCRELLPIMQAYISGRTVQFFGASGSWYDVNENFGLPIAEELRIKPVTSEQQNENLCESCENKNKDSCPFLGKTAQSFDCSNYQNIMKPSYDGVESETIKHLMSVCFELAHQVNSLSAEVTKLRDKSFNVLLKLQKLQKKNGVKTRGKKK